MKKILKGHQRVFGLIARYWPVLSILVVLIGLFYYYILSDLPSPTKLASQNISQSTEIFDRNGKLLYTIYAQKNQTFIPLSEIPKSLQEATIAIEDKDFYHHGAIDLKGILRAAFAIIFHHQIQGGSTLTQQLVKNSLLNPQQTIVRKLREIILSFVTEALYSKNKILEMYLNQIPYGGTAWGIEAASETYFGEHAKNLDLAQSALLAGLPEAPSAFSPFGSHPELAKARQEEVLKKMYEQHYISKNQMQKAEEEKLNYKSLGNNIKAPHFVLYVKDLLVKKYGERMVEEGGLKVTTSLDLSIQDFAQKEVANQIAHLKGYHVTNGAALVTDPATGEILAMVGSRNYFDRKIDGNVNVTLARRQPGSSIKPINYAVGLLNGYTAATPFVDEPICFPNPGRASYCPGNYDHKWHGVVQMRFALANSINIPAVKMLKLNGVKAMIATASAMGITTFTNPNRYGLSLTLGGAEVTMLDMATAYGVFANEGYRVNLHPVLKVMDSKGNILQQYNPPQSPIFGKKILTSGVAYIISNILADNNARSMEFGTNSPLFIPGHTVSVKTGTTNDFRDNWTIGYTPKYVVAVWVGNDDDSPMQGLVSGITGAAPIWHGIMAHLLDDRPSESLARPGDIVQKKICATSGLLPPPPGTPNRCPTRFEYFIKGTEPKTIDPGAQKVWIDKTTNDLAKPGQTNNLELKDEIVVQDPTGDRFCLTCPHPTPTPQP
ncbi:penicillin-binding protein [Patescibacteria group bacterium]|nr:penicillin-binding protein [Patescibacteria group bacterium]MCL5010491.1 penicillin-binding protein [Patescibacteria group bacterium]